MHDLQPMQRSGFRSTIPSSRFSSALVGQISTQGASLHWLQRRTEAAAHLGELAGLGVLHPGAEAPQGTSFSDLQATVHAWQPMQREWSMTNPSCTVRPSGRSESSPPGSRLRARNRVLLGPVHGPCDDPDTLACKSARGATFALRPWSPPSCSPLLGGAAWSLDQVLGRREQRRYPAAEPTSRTRRQSHALRPPRGLGG